MLLQKQILSTALLGGKHFEITIEFYNNLYLMSTDLTRNPGDNIQIHYSEHQEYPTTKDLAEMLHKASPEEFPHTNVHLLKFTQQNNKTTFKIIATLKELMDDPLLDDSNNRGVKGEVSYISYVIQYNALELDHIKPPSP